MSLEGIGDDFDDMPDCSRRHDGAKDRDLEEAQNRAAELFQSNQPPLDPFFEEWYKERIDGGITVYGKERLEEKNNQEICSFKPIERPYFGASQRLPTLGISDERILILGVNGIATSLEDALSHQAYLKSLVPEKIGIDFVYNHSNSAFVDILEMTFLNYGGFSPNVEKLLKDAWTEFYEKNKDHPERKILQICHSGAALHVFNALLDLPEEIRNLLFIVSIAPAKMIPESICYRSLKYASKNDCVYLAELTHASFFDTNEFKVSQRSEKILEELQDLILLDPHPEAKTFDHGFESPTFKPILEAHLRAYLESAC